MAVDSDEDFDAFYTATYRKIVSHIFALTGSLPEAEDCVQEAYARAWQRWAKVSTEVESPEAWVRSVAARLAVSAWRKAVNRRRAHRRDQQPTETAGMNPDAVAVISALRKISPDQRMALVLFHYAGLSVEEIAAETRMSASAVKARLARGRKALAPHLSESPEALGAPPLPRASYRPEPRRGEN
ncbi:MAG TPA: sigma-70 family RNA polymerase sigma factor [Actinospica sp.]|nr:sigma-70 family RNA polymerase sigma factor [Actinospica sp.]